jgi:hypothetical protein
LEAGSGRAFWEGAAAPCHFDEEHGGGREGARLFTGDETPAHLVSKVITSYVA